MTRLPSSALLAAMLALGLAATPARADDYAFGFDPRSGDAWIDARLGDVNVFARGNLDGYVDEVVVSTGAPAPYVRQMVVDRGWAPGDVYYACLLAREIGRPCSYVVDAYERESRGRGRGWGALAQDLGIRPGSAAFHDLKNGVGNSEARMQGRGRGGDGHRGPPPGRGGNGKGKDKGRGGG